METLKDCQRIAELLDKMAKDIPDECLDEDNGLLYYRGNFEQFGNNEWEAMEDELFGLCIGTVVDTNGYPLESVIATLLYLGVEAYAGDSDSFGWLVGCLRKGNRVYTFG